MSLWRRTAAVLVVLTGFQAPPPQPQASGTGAISGVVVSTGSSPQPIRRAVVKLSASGNVNRAAITDDNGQFNFALLPPGTFSLSVSKPAYVTTTFGQKGSGAGTPIVLKEGERLTNLRVPLTRGSVITGTVRDQAGDPVRDLPVFVARADAPPSDSVRVDTVITDDTGTYRIYGLVPGTYLVGSLPRPAASSSADMAALTRAQVDAELRMLQQRTGAAVTTPATPAAAPAASDRRFTYAPVFHPSAIAAEQAVPIVLGPGEERRGVDITVVLAAVASISGTVIGADGQPTSAVSIEFSRPSPTLPLGAALDASPTRRPAPDGTFKATNLVPGTYTLIARSIFETVRTNAAGQVVLTSVSSTPTEAAPFYTATTTVELSGADVGGVVLQLRLAPTMTGKVAFDSATQTQPANLSTVRLQMSPDGNRLSVFSLGGGSLTGAVRPDGSFEMKGLSPGAYTFTGQVPGAANSKPWRLRSVMMAGRDLLDQPLVVGDASFSDVVATFTDRQTELSGTLETSAGAPASDFVIIAMPADRALWKSTRRVQSTRPATNGQYTFADLPPGDYLISIATDAPENWKTEDFLSTVAGAGVKVTLGEGEKKTQLLRISR